MANVLFTRKNASEIPNVPITDGQLIFSTSGNGKMYLDNGTERLEMGGALTVDATLSKTSTNPVQNKAVAGVMLDTLSDISNVTSKGFLTDALALKEVNSSLVADIYVGDDGNLHKVQGGADSVLPFSKIENMNIPEIPTYARTYVFNNPGYKSVDYNLKYPGGHATNSIYVGNNPSTSGATAINNTNYSLSPHTKTGTINIENYKYVIIVGKQYYDYTTHTAYFTLNFKN